MKPFPAPPEKKPKHGTLRETSGFSHRLGLRRLKGDLRYSETFHYCVHEEQKVVLNLFVSPEENSVRSLESKIWGCGLRKKCGYPDLSLYELRLA